MTRIAVTLSAFVIAGAAATGLALAGGADHESAPVPAAASSSPPASTAAPGSVVTARRSRYGTVLFDGRGYALYLFTRERGGTP